MITARRTELVRVPDLHAFRHAVAELCAATPEPSVVLVPTDGAARQLTRDLAGRLGADAAIVLTREGLYSFLHARLPDAPRRLSAFERDALAQAAAEATAHRPPESSDGDDGPGGLPFRLRPGLIAELLKFYDQLRRQSRRLERFAELIEETLGGESSDSGTDRLLAQTRFLNSTFREYERRAAASGGCDEHMLRDRLMTEPALPLVRHVIVTMADWIAEPDGLFIGDFDLLARIPGLERLDLICTEGVLASGFHERLHDWWPGLEERNVAAPGVKPRLEVPAKVNGELWFTFRDREEELASVAQHLRSIERQEGAPPDYGRVAVVFKRPLPYLYLADGAIAAAGIPFQKGAALPLAAEPAVAAVDLVLEAVESDFSRDALIALVGSPHWSPDERLDRTATRALDMSLRERGYLGDLSRLADLAERLAPEIRPALDAVLERALLLAPLRSRARASVQVRRLIDYVERMLRPVEPLSAIETRETRTRDVMLDVLREIETAHAHHHDPDWTIEDLAAAVRRWIGEYTFADETAATGVHLLDDRAARYAGFDDMTIVGLVESEWPDRQPRNIFYPSGLLRSLGWHSETTRRRAADARFLDLLASADRRVAVSTILLDDEAIVMRSLQLDEIPRARLATLPSTDDLAHITADQRLASESNDLASLPVEAQTWAELRSSRTAKADPAYHGAIGSRERRPWSVSALEVYLTCPFKFFAQHILKLEDEPEEAEVMDPRQQGQFMHRVFEVFFETWQSSGRRTITPETLDEARAVFAEVVEDELKKLPEAEAGLERTRLLGSSAAAGLGEAVLRMEAERTVPVVERLLEHRLDGLVRLDTPEGPRIVELRGKADRLDLLEDGTFRLIDYKLGWPPQRSRALQLPIYALAAEQRLSGYRGKSWSMSEAAYLAFKGPKRVVPLVSVQTDRARVMSDAQQRVAATIDAIEAGQFPPTPEDVFLCETCSFSAVCRKDYVGDV